MSRICIILFFVIFSSHSNAQDYYYINNGMEKLTIPEKLFSPVTVYTESGKIFEGFATLPGAEGFPFRFIHDKSENTVYEGYVLQNKWVYEFEGETISRMVFHMDEKDYEIERVFFPVIKQYEFYYKLYENENVKLFTTFLEYYYTPNAYSQARKLLAYKNTSVDYIIQLNEENPKYIRYRYKNIESATIPKSVTRRFKECPSLYNRLKSNEFNASYGDLIKVLDIYSEICDKNK
ncbi:hypothetical protein [Aquimarina rubra]|uniref:DUF4369 domain-containing protein n=1 Tax=Aquimarina rubra TaxID=1920033 RepID=A0ABW5LPC1_9FLAO